MPKHIPPEVKTEAVRLRQEERLGIKAIAARSGLSIGTVARLVEPFPLTGEERLQKIRFGNGKKKGRARREVEASSLYERFGKREYTNNEKGRIAESAVLLRLHLLQCEVYGSTYGGDHIDWVVPVGDAHRLIKVQVRWAWWGAAGAPSVRTTCATRTTTRPFDPRHMDVLVGYDFVTDTAYVYLASEVFQKRMLSMRDDAAEAWDKIFRVPQEQIIPS